MVKKNAVIRNQAGIHCRPSAILVGEGSRYEGTIRVVSDAGECNLTSTLEIIMLGLEEGAEVTIYVEGPDEEMVGSRLVELFETHFDFPPQ